MNPEVIFIFVVLAIINSIFNKNKVQKKQQQRRNQQMQNQQSQSQQRPEQAKSRDTGDYGLSERRKASSSENREQTQPQRQKPRSLLEEVLEQYNIREDNAPSKPKEQASKVAPVKVQESSTDDGHYTDYSKRDQPKKSRKKKELKGYSKSRKKGMEAGELSGNFFEKTSVEKTEIGADSFSELLKFDQQSLVRGIVMAEILKKPKSMEKKKVG